MSKRTQEESGEERIMIKSRPMKSLIARAPSTLSSSASESMGKRSYKSQSPLSAQAEKYDRTGNLLFVLTQVTSKATTTDSLARYSEWDDVSGNLMNGWMTERGNPLCALKEERTRLKHVSLVNTRTSFWEKKKITIERGDLLFTLNEEHSNSSLGTTKQNQICRLDPDHS